MITDYSVTTRRIEFDRQDVPQRHFVAEDLLFSHLLAVLSSMFPEGEKFFVHSVRHYRDRIDDPDLRRQIGGFIGQESIHGREHDRLNELLQAQGYPTVAIDHDMRRLFSLVSRILPHSSQLAMTAFMEHVTAVIGEHLLTDPAFEDQDISVELSAMLRWHALEECEHKAVAFDALGAVDANGAVRVSGLVCTLAIVGPFLVGALARSIASDPASRNPFALVHGLRGLRSNPFARAVILRRLAGYLRPGFHPEDHDTTELVVRCREELFGPNGTLADRVLSA